MARPTIVALRLVIAAILLGSVFVQAVMLPLLATDLAEDFDDDVAAVRVPVVVIVALGILCVQVTMISVWRLLTMVRRGTVFSPRAFRHVDVIIGAIAVAAALTFALGAVLAPGEAAAPGAVLLIGGFGVLLAGVALIVLVQRALLVQAVGRDAQAQQLEAELGDVI